MPAREGCDMPAAPGEFRSDTDRLREALAFFASVIKSGEPWTKECERMFRAALAAPSPAPEAAPATGTVHELKTWPLPFGAILDGRKRFEIRKDDRDFKEGDTLRLREWTPDHEYTGRETLQRVTYYVSSGSWGILAPLCVMGIEPSPPPRSPETEPRGDERCRCGHLRDDHDGPYGDGECGCGCPSFAPPAPAPTEPDPRNKQSDLCKTCRHTLTPRGDAWECSATGARVGTVYSCALHAPPAPVRQEHGTGPCGEHGHSFTDCNERFLAEQAEGHGTGPEEEPGRPVNELRDALGYLLATAPSPDLYRRALETEDAREAGDLLAEYRQARLNAEVAMSAFPAFAAPEEEPGEVTEAELAEWERLANEATPGPWMAEKSMRDECSVHYAVRTVENMPDHPWSPRFVAWMTGGLREYLPPSQRPRWHFCTHCQRGYWDGRAVPVEVRDDPEIHADAEFLVAARTAVPALIAALRASRARRGEETDNTQKEE